MRDGVGTTVRGSCGYGLNEADAMVDHACGDA
ncbi:hypothetical protein UC8_54370 [Roseimaritima ulvae]|uniref:Uncharacterized protein n=1 Tax=Roseimaritima ulvae TaxID=980254 RepID=A0A5B9QWG6_9BACT|nr:hypothetical protein UC8_54370 [Roseimaritima ulvae]